MVHTINNHWANILHGIELALYKYINKYILKHAFNQLFLNLKPLLRYLVIFTIHK